MSVLGKPGNHRDNGIAVQNKADVGMDSGVLMRYRSVVTRIELIE